MLHVVDRPGTEVDREPRLRLVPLLPQDERTTLGWLGWIVVAIAAFTFIWAFSGASDTPASMFAGDPETFYRVDAVVLNDADPSVLAGIEGFLGVESWEADVQVTAMELEQDSNGNIIYEVAIRGETRGETWIRYETVVWSPELAKVVP